MKRTISLPSIPCAEFKRLPISALAPTIIALTVPSITRDDAHHMLTMRLPLSHHLAFVSRVNNAICMQLSALKSHNPAYAALEQDIVFRDNFPSVHEPGIGATMRLDACCYLVQEPVIPVALAVAEAGNYKQLEDFLCRVFKKDAKVRMLVVFQFQKPEEGMGAMVEQYLRVEKTTESDHGEPTLAESVMVFRNLDGTFPPWNGRGKGQALTLPMPLFRGTNDPKELFPGWEEEISISLCQIYQMLYEEEFKLKFLNVEQGELQSSWEVLEAEPVENQKSKVTSP